MSTVLPTSRAQSVLLLGQSGAAQGWEGHTSELVAPSLLPSSIATDEQEVK